MTDFALTKQRGIWDISPIGSMYGIYANIRGILMVNVTIYSIHGSYGYSFMPNTCSDFAVPEVSSMCLF